MELDELACGDEMTYGLRRERRRASGEGFKDATDAIGSSENWGVPQLISGYAEAFTRTFQMEGVRRERITLDQVGKHLFIAARAADINIT